MEIAAFRSNVGRLGIVVKVCGETEVRIALDSTTTAQGAVAQLLKQAAGNSTPQLNLRKLVKYYALYETVNNTSKYLTVKLNVVGRVIFIWFNFQKKPFLPRRC